ncbi:ankyrin [Obba rivulosa]|uniref:Ankyrin n=1 Tax=Obba rivulosa TaxID=1052685 RepID=A0A8E2DIJ6_9APHY|nr:ankyrin [Obba rivulosa]
MQGSGGLVLTAEMKAILRQPGFVKEREDGQRLRNLYQDLSMHFHPMLLNEFALACFAGAFQSVKEMIETGRAPDLRGTETPFKHGYISLVIFGAQRTVSGPPGTDHAATLKYLLEAGAPPDVEDVVGHTALQHASMHATELGFVRSLLRYGANVDHRNRYGETALSFACRANQPEIIELLMEAGANMDIPDADGVAPSHFYIACGPKVTAAVRKWQRRRMGEKAAFEEKKCDGCSVKVQSLKWCARCKAARYCSATCQRAHWRIHKANCHPLDASNTVTIRPRYGGFTTLFSTSEFVRKGLGIPIQESSSSRQPSMRAPRLDPDEAKGMTIKVQVPYGPDVSPSSPQSQGSLLLYNKKRNFTCQVYREDEPAAYDRIVHVVRTKGVGGAKAYFPAELKSEDKLVIKIGEVLAEQPF